MSLTPNDIMDIIATNFFGGDESLASLIVFSIVMIAIFVLVKKMIVGFIVMLPLTLAFTYIGSMPETLMIILIVVSVLGIAISSRKAVGDDL